MGNRSYSPGNTLKLLIPFLVLQVLDIALTQISLSLGGTEVGILALLYLEKFGSPFTALVMLKFAASAIIIGLNGLQLQIYRIAPRRISLFVYHVEVVALTVLSIFVVLGNVKTIWSFF